MGRLTSPPSRLAPAPYRLGVAPTTASTARRDASPLRRLYDTARWRETRRRIFERDHFTCQWPGCGRIQSDTSQLVCDHVRPHRGDLGLFWSDENLQTLCKSPCHDKHKQTLEQISRHEGGVWD